MNEINAEVALFPFCYLPFPRISNWRIFPLSPGLLVIYVPAGAEPVRELLVNHILTQLQHGQLSLRQPRLGFQHRPRRGEGGFVWGMSFLQTMVDRVLGVDETGHRFLNWDAGEQRDFGAEFLAVAKLTLMIPPPRCCCGAWARAIMMKLKPLDPLSL